MERDNVVLEYFFGDNGERNISEFCDESGNNEGEIIPCIEALIVVKEKFVN